MSCGYRDIQCTKDSQTCHKMESIALHTALLYMYTSGLCRTTGLYGYISLTLAAEGWALEVGGWLGLE